MGESIVNLLIKAQANVNETDMYGKTALFYAIGKQNETMVKLLLEKDADVEKNEGAGGVTPLMFAVKNEKNLLIKAKANVDVNLYGQIALVYAIKRENETIVKLL